MWKSPAPTGALVALCVKSVPVCGRAADLLNYYTVFRLLSRNLEPKLESNPSCRPLFLCYFCLMLLETNYLHDMTLLAHKTWRSRSMNLAMELGFVAGLLKRSTEISPNYDDISD
uniref:Putative secreted protein n=1 Tax=Anopheles triannulatus TaxID=58253 RepID=A0A2M4B6W0_9DIPT